ncbi:MAG: ATP-binding protein [Thermodesulfobacteriota bacterium]
MDFSKCDAVELWLKEHGKYFRCEATRHPKQPPSFRITSYVQDVRDGMISGPDNDPNLLHLCSEMIRCHVDPSRPGFTKNGSFWTADTKKPILSRSKTRGRSHVQGLNISGDYRSLGLIPLLIDNRNIGLLLLKSKAKNHFAEGEVELYEYLGQNLGIALAHRNAQVDLRERVKELICLYGIARLVAEPGVSLEEILKRIVEVLPSAWLYPEIAFARITLDKHSYSTPAFPEGKHKLTAEIVVDERVRGGVEVAYGEQKPDFDEGPFYKEEQNLLDTVAKEIGIIIKRREVEDDQRRLQDQLRHADRLATIGQLAAGVAHELNEPLSNILGFAQLAKKCNGLPRQAELDIEKILTASLNAREVVKKLLIFARKLPPRKTRVNLNQLVDEGIQFFESRCAKDGIEVVRSLSPDLPEIDADPAQLNQVLVNLIVNALQAMPTKGRLTIQTLTGKEMVSLIVEDTGIGMSEEVRKQIFTPFFTTKDVGQGTGLGLPVVHGIVTSHGGSIKVESKPNQGSRFAIQLPVMRPQDFEAVN